MTRLTHALSAIALCACLGAAGTAAAQSRLTCPVDGEGNWTLNPRPGVLYRSAPEGTVIHGRICRDGRWVLVPRRVPIPDFSDPGAGIGDDFTPGDLGREVADIESRLPPLEDPIRGGGHDGLPGGDPCGIIGHGCD